MHRSEEFYDKLQNSIGGGKPKMRWYFGKHDVVEAFTCIPDGQFKEWGVQLSHEAPILAAMGFWNLLRHIGLPFDTSRYTGS